MTVGSLGSSGPVRAVAFDRPARERAEARPEPQVATVEVVRPLDRQARLRADTDVLRSEPATERRRLDIRV